MINIAFCFDNKLKDKIFNVINSINANTDSKIRYFFLLEKGFDPVYIAKYKTQLFNIIENVEMPEIINFNKTIIKSKAMFYRWLIADKLPMIDRVIYLDVDILLNADIQKLWDIDLKNNVIGLVPCQFGQKIRDTIRYQGLVSDVEAFTDYGCDIDKRNFLSGQMLIDLKKWREMGLTKKLIDFVIKNKTADMIALNIVCQNHILELDYRWSAPANQLSESLQGHAPCISKDYSKAFLYHFHGIRKPWDKGYTNKKLLSMWEKYNEI